MTKGYMTIKQIEDYQRMCQERAAGRLLTTDGLLLVCEAFENDPEQIGKHFLEIAAKIKAEKGYL